MIVENKLLINNIETNFIVFDEPFKEYYELALIAASSHDPLSENYKRPIHIGKEFTTLILMESQPIFMFATERDPLLPKNVARGFVRTFMNPSVRKQNFGSGIGKYTEFFKYFYNLFPQYHQKLGIDTIFVTRNYRNRKERGLEKYFKPTNFQKFDHPVMYNNCPQWMFVHGDPNFCDTLPKYNESSE